MTYAANLEKEGISSNYLAILKPDVLQENWIAQGGNVFKVSFSLGNVIGVSQDGTAFTEASSGPPAFGEFFWDFTNEELFINTNTPGSSTMIVTYELYVATQGLHWNREPTNSSSREVYFEPLIIIPPNFKATLSDSLFGFLPSQGSAITIGNPDHTYEQVLYASSFNQKDVEIYHVLGDLETANIKLVIKALGGNINYSSTMFTISLLDRIDIFSKEWRNTGVNFYNSTDFPNIDIDAIGRPVRFVAGVSDSLVCTNLDFVDENPGTSDNRDWGVRTGALNAVTQTVSAAPASTVSRTYVDSANGLNIGDSVWIDKATDEYRLITAVNRSGSQYIEHAALVSGAASSGDLVKRGTVAWVGIEQGGVQYKALFERDYTESVSNGVVTFTFKTTMESTAGVPNTLDSGETVYCRVYGEVNAATIGGSPFGSDSAEFSALTNPAVILYNILKSHLGITENEINTSSFQTLSSAIGSENIGVTVPENIGNSYPNYKKVITKMMRSNLILLYLDDDSKWAVDVLAPLGSEDKTIEEDEILENTIRYNIKYTDILSDIVTEYNHKEFTNKSDKETANSDLASFLHGVSKQKTFDTYLLQSSDAATLASRLSFVFGDRSGQFTIKTKNRFFDTVISDVIKVQLSKLLGFAFDSDTLRNRDFNVLELDKGLREISILLNDQKGIFDNSGSW